MHTRGIKIVIKCDVLINYNDFRNITNLKKKFFFCFCTPFASKFIEICYFTSKTFSKPYNFDFQYVNVK